jgi:hypothetical protein
MPVMTIRLSRSESARIAAVARKRRISKTQVVREALQAVAKETTGSALDHLQALDELPAKYIIHPRIVVSRKAGEKMLRQAKSARPTPALRKLMRNGD